MAKNKIIIKDDHAIILDKHNREILVDVEDLSLLMPYRWYVDSQGYPAAWMDRQTVKLQNYLMDFPDSIVDHKNNNTLDNRKANLREASHKQNIWNSKSKRSKSGYTGVRKEGDNSWQAEIVTDGKTNYLGVYPTPEEAAVAYDRAALETRGDFAKLNFDYGEGSPMDDRVVHCKRHKYDIYIGRGSKWGNPYKIPQDGDRDTVIQKYEDYIRDRPGLLDSLPELRGKVLGCWCKPKPCHGDVLIKLLKEFGIE